MLVGICRICRGDFRRMQDLRGGIGRLGIAPRHDGYGGRTEQTDSGECERRLRHGTRNSPEPAEKADGRDEYEDSEMTIHELERGHDEHTFRRIKRQGVVIETVRAISAPRSLSEAVR